MTDVASTIRAEVAGQLEGIKDATGLSAPGMRAALSWTLVMIDRVVREAMPAPTAEDPRVDVLAARLCLSVEGGRAEARALLARLDALASHTTSPTTAAQDSKERPA